MAHIIIDRRKNSKGKSTENRQKYVRRVKEQVRDAVKDVIRDGNIKDIVDAKGKKVRIPGKGLNKPQFQHDEGGISDRVYPGNKDFTQGDRINRPQGGGGKGGGKGASDSGDGSDGFEFHLTKEEFLDLFFEDLELPNLIKKEISKIDEYEFRRAGFSVDGNPSRLNIVRSMKQSKSRRFALRSGKKKKLKELEAELEALNSIDPLTSEQQQRKDDVIAEIQILRKKLKAVPFLDDVDLRFNRWEKVPIPSTQAVMMCLMDVSGSMGSWEKEMAKRFFMLLYLFLFRNYKRVDIVFVRHTTEAKEVDEEEFFYSKETGGTMVSSGINMVRDIIKERYNPQQWNIFVCQASDGDNWPADSTKVVETLHNELLPICQYFAYVEIDQRGGRSSDLWPYYAKLKDSHQNFAMTVIDDVAAIYPVFRGLFERGTKE